MACITCWVLTEEHNLYDQQGEYFVDVFREKPTLQQLINVVGCAEDYAAHILSGGGRVYPEDQWYFLREVEMK